ncbi:MAG: DNA translocase FtsK [Candidatus Omnitrophica bacterium]|nr:DNA translocase FtsK [Candidatus Omnitrophota bacterium]
MARGSESRKPKRSFLALSPERRSELAGILLLAASLLTFMSLVSYRPDDLAFFTSRPSPQVQNLCGRVGALIAGLLRSTVGFTSYLLPLVGFLWALARFQARSPQRPYVKLVSTALFCVASSSFLSIVWVQTPEARISRGGVIGAVGGDLTLHYFGWWGAAVVLLTVSLLCFLLVTELAAWPLFEGAGRLLKEGASRLREQFQRPRVSVHRRAAAAPPARPEPGQRVSVAQERPLEQPRPKADQGPVIHLSPAAPVKPVRKAAAAKEPAPAPAPAPEPEASVPKKPFRLPSLDLLSPPPASPQPRIGKEQLEANARLLEESLRGFGIDAKVAEVEMGPVITRYEVEPAPGVKVQKITTLADDLALVLKAPSVRIIAPIPGKARVGIEVPNPASSLVALREILESPEFREESSKLTLAIGKDAAGHPLTADLGEMPHLLIAGTTGSGKTVCMNALITSLLFNATPEEVRLIMVDPKMVELSVFNGIPHLILPVLTDPKKVPLALHWVVQEMETRYRLFAKLGVRNIDSYLEKQAQGQLPADEIPAELPYLVLIIDELADLMLVAQSEVEKTIARLAHLSRAVGIHMVLATQRPSVDVLTGVIKANFPARISFQVASKVDSRTVLDTMGAEKLLGKGDLLFMQPGTSKLIRAQGTLVTDEEIERLVTFLKEQRAPEYDASILEGESKPAEAASVTVKDILYPEAVRLVVETGQASVSLLQRRMRLGYGRAARILDRMEEEGIVGPIRGAKPREVYLKEVPEEEDGRGVNRRASEVGA